MQQQPHKSILKKQVSTKKELHWDEIAIEAHNQDRGNKMKIGEPKTPYHEEMPPEHEMEVEDEDIDQELQEAMQNKQKLQQEQHELNIAQLNEKLKTDLDKERAEMEDSDEDAIAKAKHDSFVQKRKQHYNEKMKIKEALKKAQLEDA